MIEGTNISLQTEEDIAKWIDERKSKWPSSKRVAQRVSMLIWSIGEYAELSSRRKNDEQLLPVEIYPNGEEVEGGVEVVCLDEEMISQLKLKIGDVRQ